jgi:hypothetical protein
MSVTRVHLPPQGGSSGPNWAVQIGYQSSHDWLTDCGASAGQTPRYQS